MTPKDKLFEQLLILRCQLRDKDAFADLIRQYERPLRYFISRLVGNSETTEELFQETWLTVIRKIHTLRNASTFPAWLYRIARNNVYQQFRDKRQLSEIDENIQAADITDDDISLPDDISKLHKCLDRLSPEHKEVLMLRFLEQMSYQQMTEVLGRNLGTVRSRVHYAKMALKKEMEK